MTSIDLELENRLYPNSWTFDEGAGLFLELLRKLRSVSTFQVAWSAQFGAGQEAI
jgi:hypothetical protein